MFQKDDMTISLNYSGKDVENGTMEISDLANSLQGLASAYSRLSSPIDADTKFNLRISSINKGSFEYAVEVWKYVQDHPDQAMATIMATDFIVNNARTTSIYVVSAITNLLKLAKHVKKEPYSTKIDRNTASITVVNSENVSISVPIHVHAHFEDKKLMKDLYKLVEPLREGHIESATFTATDKEGVIAQEKVSYVERDYIDIDDRALTRTQETWLTGKFNSLTKTTNNGKFILESGKHVLYSLSAENPENLYNDFAYNGLVKVRCIAELDENLQPVRIKIFEVIKLEPELFSEDK